MWARHFEVALGIWLALSPFVFAHPAEATFLWSNDLACAALVVLLGLTSYARRLRAAHLLELLVALWLVGAGWLAARDGATSASQNHVVCGLLLGMFAIVPNDAADPPRGWRHGACTDSD